MIKRMDKWLLLLTLFLFAAGLVMVFSASNVAAFMRYQASPYRFVFKQGLFLLVSAVASMVVIRVNTKGYSILSWPLMIGFVTLLVAVLIYGKATNQATSWFSIAGFKFQPSEFIKVIAIVWLASFYEIKRNKLNSYSAAFFPIIICVGIFILIFLQPDLGTGIIFSLIVIFIFFLVPISKRIKLITTCILLGALSILCIVLISSGKDLISSRQLSRFKYFKPCSEEKFYTDGNQVCNAYIAINNGNLFGKGLGNSTQKYLYLPEAHTDFIFAILIEELGLVSGIILLILYMLVLARIVVIGRRSINIRGSIMCYGIAFYIFLHIIVNLMGILGLIPMTGVPLPFISYGGSFTMCLVVALTIVQRVAIEKNIYLGN